MDTIHTSYIFAGERQEERFDVEGYKYVNFDLGEQFNFQSVRTLLVNKSQSGFCLLYIGKHVFYKDQTLTHSNGKQYEVAWVETGRGHAQFIGVQKIVQSSVTRAKPHFVLIDEISKDLMSNISDLVSKFKSKSSKPVQVTIFYVEKGFDKLIDYEYEGPTVILTYSHMKDIMASIDHVTRKFAILCLDQYDWRQQFVKILKTFFNIPIMEMEKSYKLRESNVRTKKFEKSLEQMSSMDRNQTNRIMTVFDELTMNGFYDAPRDECGIHIHDKQDRKNKVILPKGKALEVSYLKDDDFFWIRVRDAFGSLDPATYLKYIQKGIEGGQDVINFGSGGAGLGLYMIFQYCSSIHIKINPGQETIFLVSLNLDSKAGRQEQNRCFIQCNT